MYSNNTSTTIPTTTGTADTTATGRPRLRALVGGVIAVGGLTFGIGAALAQESPSSAPAVSDHPAIAEMARANGLTGLSPASLSSAVVAARPDAAIADWARANGLTGLSPASLASAAPSTATSAAADWYADSAAIADWARANGMTGLSPASLAPSDD